jgi:hypothetical protein
MEEISSGFNSRSRYLASPDGFDLKNIAGRSEGEATDRSDYAS